MADAAPPDLFVELRLDQDLAHLSLIKGTAESFLSRSGFSEDEIYRIVIAIYEASSNVVEHAYGPGVEGEIALRMEMRGDLMTVEVRDWGASFDLGSVKEIDWDQYLESGKKRGLGIHLMRQVMDDVAYYPARPPTGNLLVMRRKVAPEGAAAPD